MDLRGGAWLVAATLVVACSVTTTPSPTATASPTPIAVAGELSFGAGSDRQVPGDGLATATLEARLSDGSGSPVAGRDVELRPLGNGMVTVTPPTRSTDTDGRAEFEVSSGVAGSQIVQLFVAGTEASLAQMTIDFTRKVVVLAPGFQSALASRFEIFGQPGECADAMRPSSITEALICLGYRPNAADDPAVGVPTPGATIVDMSWEATRCRPSDAADARDCVATIRPTDDGTDVLWQPAEYDLATLTMSMARQSSVDLWAHRLATTMLTYDDMLARTRGVHASFYLVGHSLGGEVVVRVLRAALADNDLAGGFAADNRGRLPLVLSVDGALNWTGGIEFFSGETHCGMPVFTRPDDGREVDNVDAVEQAWDRFGSLTVAVTADSDPVVPPAVALLQAPATPARGYEEANLPGAGDCAHSSLLRPDPGPPITYPLNDLLVRHVGRAAGG